MQLRRAKVDPASVPVGLKQGAVNPVAAPKATHLALRLVKLQSRLPSLVLHMLLALPIAVHRPLAVSRCVSRSDSPYWSRHVARPDVRQLKEVISRRLVRGV